MASLLLVGAVIAGYDSLDSNMIGYILVWCNNFFSSIQNVVVSKLNEDKKLSPFEINFYFACAGLVFTIIMTNYTGDIYALYDVFINPATRDF